MVNKVLHRSSGEGVFLWIKLAAIVGIVSLILSMLSMSPTQAYAQETSETPTTEPSSVDEEPTEVDSVLELLDEVTAILVANKDIDVNVESILVDGKSTDEKAETGDTVVISGS